MKAVVMKKLALVFLCIGVAAFSLYTLFVLLWPSGDMQISYVLPVSDIFKVNENTLFFFKIDIESNVTLVGNLKEVNGLCFKFYVLNETNMEKMLTDQHFSSYVKVFGEGPQKYHFTFTTDRQGSYYFVFDNTGLCQDKIILFELKPQEKAEGS